VGTSSPGQIVILNGAPRSGKTSIAHALQELGSGEWVNLGVDASMGSLPEQFRPGIGLRPGGERPDLEERVVTLYADLWDSVAAQARLGLNVVVDVGIHDAYSAPRQIARDAARRLEGLPVLVVGVRCPIEVIWDRRRESWGQGFEDADDETVAAVVRWQSAVHHPLDYDLEVDTSSWSPTQCADAIVTRLAGPPGVALFQRRDLLAP
jgi:chloramphenicol 3-O phosphotransferase